MKDTKLKVYTYKCNCGHIVKIFFDSGIPHEFYKCRRCGVKLRREEM